jgi:hypothetical protein
MAPNRIMRGRAMRRALLLAAAVAVLAAVLTACGGGGSSSTVAEKEADIAVLNEILGRQQAAIAAYEQVLPRLRGPALLAARQFRAQEQEHVDATMKILWGIGGKAEPAAETIEAEDLKTQADALNFLYEMESGTIHIELGAVERLHADWPRPRLAAMAANGAQHLVLVRRGLGAKPLETVPEAFETGDTPAPEEMMGK